MPNSPLIVLYIVAYMRKTFEDRVAIYGEYSTQTTAPMPAGYMKALEAQKLAKATTQST
jgi:hypothetical protein